MKLQKLAEKQLIDMPEPEFDSARAEIEELWTVGIPFTKDRIGQYFWPAEQNSWDLTVRSCANYCESLLKLMLIRPSSPHTVQRQR